MHKENEKQVRCVEDNISDIVKIPPHLVLCNKQVVMSVQKLYKASESVGYRYWVPEVLKFLLLIFQLNI